MNSRQSNPTHDLAGENTSKGVAGTATLTATTWKHVWLFLVLPVCISAALLCFAFYLKHREMVGYINPVWRVAIIVVAAVLGAVPVLIFWLATQTKLLRALGISFTSKKPVAGIVISLGTLLIALPLIFIGVRLKEYNGAIEERALAETGIKTRAFVIDSKKVRTKYRSHYKVYLRFQVGSGEMVEESFKQKQLTVHAGDTIPVVYLAVNPAVFRVEGILKD
jgi:hypothetical protein